MCGIAGFYGNFPKALLGQMAAALAHRGPDGEGLWHSPALGIGLAHRRLSIIDLSSAASQPMAGVNGRYQVVFNGEIYNFKSLVQHPQLHVYSFNTSSDTAVLAPLYDALGPAMLHQLEGMFAFALADTQTGTLFIARDHAGIKPLYYAVTSQGVLFASELKALAAVATPAAIDLTPDSAALQEYVSFLWTPSVRTPVQGIRKLRPGHALKLTRGQGGRVVTEVTRWWHPPQPSLPPEGPITPAKLAQVWDEIVAEQCTADVPPGAFLSGGVDSSAVVASMVATGHAPAQTYCIGFKGTGMAAEGFDDDAYYANLMATYAGVPLKTLQVDVNATLATLPQLAWQLDEPTADPAPLLVTAISQQARTDGLKLLMSGTGGDDVLTGYRRHQSARLREMLRPLGLPLGGSAGTLCSLLARMTRGATQRRLERLAGLLGGTDDDFLVNAFLTNSQPDAALLVAQPGANPEACGEELRAAIATTRGLSLVERLLQAEWAGFLPDHNLNYGDKAGMAAGVEIRVPFTDRRLMQLMAHVPSHQKMQGLQPKAFFKQAMSGRVPAAILNRSKTGFGAPLRTWLQHEGQALMRDVVLDCNPAHFNRARVQQLWQRTMAQEIDGTYTILAVAMTEWWFAALKQSSGSGSKPA